MSSSNDEYEIVFKNNRVQRGWEQLEREFPERMEECERFLKANPLDRRKAIGILKKLKGNLAGIMQYDVTKDDARVWYTVDKDKKEVLIKYAGPHPE